MLTRPHPHPVVPRTEMRARGFTLIELLVVVIVLGVLAAIAVPVYLGQRDKARLASAKADARNLGSALESMRTDGTYPAAVGETAAEVTGAKLSPTNKVARYTTSNDGFQACVIATDGATTKAYALYDSTSGGLVASGAGAGPAACAPAAPTPPALVGGVACPVITWGTPAPKYLAETTEYRVSVIYNDPTISRITEIGGVAVYIDQGALRRFDFSRATGVNFVNAPMKVRGSNGYVRTDCTTTFTWPPD